MEIIFYNDTASIAFSEDEIEFLFEDPTTHKKHIEINGNWPHGVSIVPIPPRDYVKKRGRMTNSVYSLITNTSAAITKRYYCHVAWTRMKGIKIQRPGENRPYHYQPIVSYNDRFGIRWLAVSPVPAFPSRYNKMPTTIRSVEHIQKTKGNKQLHINITIDQNTPADTISQIIEMLS